MDIRIEWRPGPKPAQTVNDTRWSLVRAASGQPAGVALGELCARYWCAAYAYVRRCGHPPAVSQSVTAAFFAQLAGAPLNSALRGVGQRFREFLLAQLREAHAREWCDLRGASIPAVVQAPLPAEVLEDRYLGEVADSDTPEQAFARGFSHALVAHSFARLRAEALARGRAAMFEQLLDQLRCDPHPADAARAAAATGLTSAAAGFALRSLRQRLREIVNEEISDTLGDPSDLEQEARALGVPGLR